MAHTTSIDLGDDVLISRGGYISGPDITIGDEVMLGPYVCVVAGNHTKLADSYRWGPREERPIQTPLNQEEESFLNKAKQLYQERRSS